MQRKRDERSSAIKQSNGHSGNGAELKKKIVNTTSSMSNNSNFISLRQGKVKSLLHLASILLLAIYIFNIFIINSISRRNDIHKNEDDDSTLQRQQPKFRGYDIAPKLFFIPESYSSEAVVVEDSLVYMDEEPTTLRVRIAPPSSSSSSSSSNSGCLSIILYSYAAAALVWNIILSATKKNRVSLTIFNTINIGLLAGITIEHSKRNVQCKESKACYKCLLDENNNNHTNVLQHSHNIIATKRKDVNDDMNIRISFTLHDVNDDHYVLHPDAFSKENYRCDDRPKLPPYLGQRTVLNFKASVYTDLNVVWMGDSIGAQFAQAFDAASIGKANEEHRWTQGYRYLPKKNWVSECLTISDIQGGGISSFWRVTGLMSDANKQNHYFCDRDHHNNKGWAASQSTTLLDDGYNLTAAKNRGAYHAFVMRVPHGWLNIDEITKEGIIEEIQLINKYLGAQTVIISTLPLSNNVVTYAHWTSIQKINDIIHDIAHNWPVSDDDHNGIKTVLVQEFSNYTSQIIYSNAKHIGLYNGTMPDFTQRGWEMTNKNLMFERLTIQGKWPPSKAQVCVSRKFWFNDRGEQCHLNRISVDGSHWCTNSLGPRHSASIACLLGCVYNGDAAKDMKEIRICEQVCNDQFMTINPVDDDWIGTGTTLFAT